jgi:hypothetical protein
MGTSLCFVFGCSLLLFASAVNAQVLFTNATTIAETNTTYDGQDIVVSGTAECGMQNAVAIDGFHAFNSLLNGKPVEEGLWRRSFLNSSLA